MIIKHNEIKKIDMGKGIVRQDFAKGKNLNALHWNIRDKGIVGMHTHSQEQLGLVIKGGFELTINGTVTKIYAGDAYLVPANVPHAFVAIGETVAYDIFSPVKSEFPWDLK